MEHPFIKGLDDKTLEELQSTISSLTSKLNFAYRTNNSALIHQINMALGSYRAAYSRKMEDMIAKQQVTSQIKVESKK